MSHRPVVHFSSRTLTARSAVTNEVVSRAAAAYPAHPAETIELERIENKSSLVSYRCVTDKIFDRKRAVHKKAGDGEEE